LLGICSLRSIAIEEGKKQEASGKKQKIRITKHGADWNRQERILSSKHAGARLVTPLTNNDQTNLTGERSFAMAA